MATYHWYDIEHCDSFYARRMAQLDQLHGELRQAHESIRWLQQQNAKVQQQNAALRRENDILRQQLSAQRMSAFKAQQAQRAAQEDLRFRFRTPGVHQ